jgi:Cd2+/Zn2+-exporting ATPase
MLEDYASDNSRKSIASIAQIRPETANIKDSEGRIVKVSASEVEIGSEIYIMPHERVPLDGVVIEGSSVLDTSALTGEAMPFEVQSGSAVLSGMINGSSGFSARTTAEFSDSAASRIIEMVETAAERKGSSQKLITRLAKIYTPVVVILGILLAAVPSLITGDWRTWVYRGLVFLVASCPCALVLSVPLGFFAGIGAAAKAGILVKGGKFIESLAQAKTAVFDKTGTLTTGQLTVKSLIIYNGFSESDVKEYAVAAERYSEHPLALAIVAAFNDAIISDVGEIEELAGGGTKVKYGIRNIICGGKNLMEDNGIDISAAVPSPVYVAVDGILAGSIEAESEIKSDAPQTIEELKRLGIKKTFMLTGDSRVQAQAVSEVCGIDEYYAELLPDEKLELLLKIKKEHGSVVYVGDGINDAPVLAAADTGVAMGLGTQAAMQAADIVLTGKGLSRLSQARKQFQKIMSVVKFNIFFSLAAKGAGHLLGVCGLAPMWAAVFADVGVLIITVAKFSCKKLFYVLQ